MIVLVYLVVGFVTFWPLRRWNFWTDFEPVKQPIYVSTVAWLVIYMVTWPVALPLTVLTFTVNTLIFSPISKMQVFPRKKRDR